MTEKKELAAQDCSYCHKELAGAYGEIIDERDTVGSRLRDESINSFSGGIPEKLAEILKAAIAEASTDVHLKAGEPPFFRLSGRLVRKPDFGVFTAQYLHELARELASDLQWRRIATHGDCDLGVEIEGVARFRINIFLERNNYSLAFRLLPSRIAGFEELGLPVKFCRDLCLSPRGLVLITGPTGSGKTTTLAAMVDYINENAALNIVTIEDPIEYCHQSKRSLICQREIGHDAVSFDSALRGALRQDPDVIMVGEMRDLETIRIALTAAETGHLVLGTLHTNSATSTIERIVDVFPPHQQSQIRLQLSLTLVGMMSQTLLRAAPRASRDRVLAVESLIVTPGVRNMIRECKSHQLYSIMQAGTQRGMKTLDMDLMRLVRENKITSETAMAVSHHPEDFKKELAASA